MALAKKPFVVLDAEILSSSVWSESLHVRMVWITLLILCDSEGYVGAAVPGIASAAGVTLQQAQEALARFQEPDPFSRTQTNEGRRIAIVDRGFRVLNFLEHIDLMSAARKRARDRVWRHRERKAMKRDETPRRRQRTTQRRQSSQRTENREQRTENNGSTDIRPPAAPPAEFPSKRAANVFHKHYPDGVPPGAMFKELRPLVLKHTWDLVEPELDAYLGQTEVQFQSWPKFAQGFGTWARGNGTALVRAGPRPPTTAAEKTAAAVEQVMRDARRGG